MKKLLLLTAALGLMGQGCLSLSPDTNAPSEPVSPQDMMEKDDSMMEDEGMMEEDAMMEDSMEKDDAMMEDDGSMMGSDTAVSVDVANFAYNPSTVTVKQGSEITFTNNDSVTHTVTANDGAFDSGNIAAGDMYTLDTSDMEPGEYAYYCTLHPNMTGTIVIE